MSATAESTVRLAGHQVIAIHHASFLLCKRMLEIIANHEEELKKPASGQSADIDKHLQEAHRHFHEQLAKKQESYARHYQIFNGTIVESAADVAESMGSSDSLTLDSLPLVASSSTATEARSDLKPLIMDTLKKFPLPLGDIEARYNKVMKDYQSAFVADETVYDGRESPMHALLWDEGLFGSGRQRAAAVGNEEEGCAPSSPGAAAGGALT